MGIKRSACLCGLLLELSVSYAQQITQKHSNQMTSPAYLDEVVVTDSQFLLKRYQSGKSIVKVTGEQLERHPSKSLLELLNSKSGIEINGTHSNAGQNLGLFVRGGTTQQVLVVIDGVPMNNLGGFSTTYDLRLLSSSEIGSVEVLKGGAASLYGSGAATAVINIMTKEAAKTPIAGNISTSFGTNQAHNDQNYNIVSSRTSALINGTIGRWYYGVGGDYNYVDGLSAAIATKSPEESDLFDKKNIYLRGGYKHSRLDIQLKAYLNRFISDIDGGSYSDKKIDYIDNKQIHLDSHIVYAINDNRYTHVSMAYDHYRLIAVNNNTSGQVKSNNVAAGVLFDLYEKDKLWNDKIYIIYGLRYQNHIADIDENSYEITQTAPYINLVYLPAFGLTINLGGRLNLHSRYGNNMVYHINPSYHISLDGDGQLKFYGSYGTAFIAPSILQRYHPQYGNLHLEPEITENIELGFAFDYSQYGFSVAYFSRTDKNRFGYNPTTYKSINLEGRLHTNGLEIESYYKPIQRLSLTANYTNLDYDNNVMRVPRDKVNFNIDYEMNSATSLSISYQYNGLRRDIGYFNPIIAGFDRVRLKPYQLLDCSVSRHFWKDIFTINLLLQNIFNEEYMEVYGYRTLGRNVLLNLKYRF